MARTPEMDDWVEQGKKAKVFDAYGMVASDRLVKTTEGYQGPCPVCGGVDRFSINLKKNMFYCRQCQVGGDAIELVRFVAGYEFIAAIEILNGSPPPNGKQDYNAPLPDAAAQRERREEKRVSDMAARAEEAKKASDTMQRVREFFDNCKPFTGSAAEAYLRARKIVLLPDQTNDLRFSPSLEYEGYADAEADEQVSLGSFPTMIAAVRNVAGEIIGVHRTYLDPKTKLKLIPPGDPKRNMAKKIWGIQKHGHIRLGPILERMAIGEGIETTASWYQLGLGPEPIGMMAGINLGNLAGGSTGHCPHPKYMSDKRRHIPNGVPDMVRPGIILPEEVRDVILLGDGDSDYFVTRAQMLCGARRFVAQGRSASLTFAPDKLDFNDVLMGAD